MNDTDLPWFRRQVDASHLDLLLFLLWLYVAAWQLGYDAGLGRCFW